MAPTAWDKAFYEKNFLATCKAFQKAATPSPAQPANGPRNPAAAGRRPHRQQPQGLPGLDELHKVLGLLKALLAEPPRIIAKTLQLAVQEQLLSSVCHWLDRSVSFMSVELAAGLAGAQASPLPHQNNLHQAITCVQRLLRILTAMLKHLTNPAQLHAEGTQAVEALAATPLDVQPLDKVLSKVLQPMSKETATGRQVHGQYRYAVLGAATNLGTALANLALHPALAGSTLSTCVLEAACVVELLPSMAGLLAHAQPAPAAGQSQEGWYEATAGALVELTAAAKEGPGAVSSTFLQGWQRAVLSPMVQEFLLERLIHGLRDVSPSGQDCPPGFESFGLLPGVCSLDEEQLLRCLQLCLDAQWLAWRSQQNPQPAVAWEAVAAVEGPALEPWQLFELTRQVAEQAMAVVAEAKLSEEAEQAQSAGIEELENSRGGLLGAGVGGGKALAAMSACATCLSDLRYLWPGVPPHQQQVQLPLVLALAANTLAFATQGLEIAAAMAGPGISPRNSQGSAGQQQNSTRAFGQHPGMQGSFSGNSDHGLQQARAVLQDALDRAVAVLAFLFPVHREGAALVGNLAALYSPQSWSEMAEQASGVLGALEMALRCSHVPHGAQSHVPLLHALAGAMQAAPGSYWTHLGGHERAGLLSTLRKLANQAAAALEANVAVAQQMERQMLALPPDSHAPGRVLSASQVASKSSSQAAKAARAAANAVDVALQQRVDLMYRLLMLVVDGNALVAAPLLATEGAPISSDPDFTGVPDDAMPNSPGPLNRHGSWNNSPNCLSDSSQPQGPSPSILVAVPVAGLEAPGSLPGAKGRKGRGEANPDGQSPPEAAPLRRASEAQLQLRGWVLAELLPTWLRLWVVQLSALLLAVRAEAVAEVSAVIQATRAAGATTPSGPQASVEIARYNLMRAGMGWLTNIATDIVPLCTSILSSHALHTSPAGPAGRTHLDPAMLSVARAARQLVSVLAACDLVPQLTAIVSQEKQRLSGLGVPQGQAGMMTTLAQLLGSLTSLPGSGRAQVARSVLEQGLAGGLAGLYDEQRRLGGKAAAAAATMDALQTAISGVEAVLADKPVNGGPGSPGTVVQVAEARKMLTQLASTPPPVGPLTPSGDAYADEGFEAQASALVDVVMDEALETLKHITGPCVGLDGVLSSMQLHVGCCHPRCDNTSQEGEHLLPLHMCQGCMRVRYCSRTCQVAAWAQHQEQCRIWNSKLAAGSGSSA